jgi:hypothetical protein
MRRVFLALILALALGAPLHAAANHGTPTYCDRWRNRMANDANVVFLSGQKKWVMDQRICVFDAATGHWKLTTVRPCDDFAYRINHPPFYLTPYEKAVIVDYADC